MSHDSKPALELKAGNVTVRCFLNQTKDKHWWYSTVFMRHYTDSEGIPRKAQSFGVNDLPNVALLALQSQEWIRAQKPNITLQE